MLCGTAVKLGVGKERHDLTRRFFNHSGGKPDKASRVFFIEDGVTERYNPDAFRSDIFLINRIFEHYQRQSRGECFKNKAAESLPHGGVQRKISQIIHIRIQRIEGAVITPPGTNLIPQIHPVNLKGIEQR